MSLPAFDAEQVTEEALKILKETNIICEFHHSKKNGELDVDGIDFLIFLNNGLCLPLQVKGSHFKQKQHPRKHPHIRFILIVKRNKPKIIAKKLKRLIDKISRNLTDLYFANQVCYTIEVK